MKGIIVSGVLGFILLIIAMMCGEVMMATIFAFLNAHWVAFSVIRTGGLIVLVVILWAKAIVPLAKGFWREYGRK